MFGLKKVGVESSIWYPSWNVLGFRDLRETKWPISLKSKPVSFHGKRKSLDIYNYHIIRRKNVLSVIITQENHIKIEGRNACLLMNFHWRHYGYRGTSPSDASSQKSCSLYRRSTTSSSDIIHVDTCMQTSNHEMRATAVMSLLTTILSRLHYLSTTEYEFPFQ